MSKSLKVQGPTITFTQKIHVGTGNPGYTRTRNALPVTDPIRATAIRPVLDPQVRVGYGYTSRPLGYILHATYRFIS